MRAGGANSVVEKTTQVPLTRRVLSIAGASIVSAGVAFVVNIISARALGPEYRGYVATVLQLAYLAAPLAGYGADRALLRSGEGKDGHTYVLPSSLAILAMAALAGLIIWPIYGAWALLAIPVALVTVLFNQYRGFAIQSQKIRGFLVCFLIYQASILLGSAGLWLLEVQTWQWWAGVYIVPGIFLAVYGLYRVRRDSSMKITDGLTALQRNGPLLTASLSKLIATRLNRVILPVMAGASSLGLFIVVATATEPLYWLAQSVADHQTSTETGRRRRRREVVGLLLKGAAIFLPLAAVGGVLIHALLVPIFGQSYAPAQSLVLPLSIASVVLASYRQMSGLLLASPTPNRVGVTEAAAAIGAVIVYPIAIFFWGMAGAAWGALVVYALGLLTGFLLYPGATQEKTINETKEF